MRLIFILLLTFFANGQQDPLFGIYWNNYSHFNPAAMCFENEHEAFITYREQQMAVLYSPRLFFVNYGSRLKNKHGIGFNFRFSESGYISNHLLNLNYNYQLILKEEKKLVFGIAAGAERIKYTGYWVFPSTADDPAISSSLPSYGININAGISFVTRNLLVGFSSTSLDRSQLDPYYRKSIHSYVHGRYRFKLTEKITMLAEGVVRTDWVKVATDFNLRCRLIKPLWINIGYRFSGEILAGFTIDLVERFKIAYQFEYPTGDNAKFGPTHEASLGYTLNKVGKSAER